MKKSRFCEEQIAHALRLAEGGTPVADVCRQIGISDATFYTWKKKYAELGLSEQSRSQRGDRQLSIGRFFARLCLSDRPPVASVAGVAG